MPGVEHSKRPRGPRVAKSTASEKEWQAQVMQLATGSGWTWWHFHDSRRQITDRSTGSKVMVGDKDALGFPDLHMVHPRWGIAYVELKTDATASKLSADQLRSLRAIAGGVSATVLGEMAPAGQGRIIAHVWRPRDLAHIVLPVLRGNRDVPRFYGFEVA